MKTDDGKWRFARITLLLTFALFSTTQLLAQAQPDKDTSKLAALLENAEYGKIIKFKKGKTSQLSAKALYYKGMAYYLTEDDFNALRFMDMAIDKGPTDYDMYYYKAMTLMYMERYQEALPNFNQAIGMNPSIPAFHSSKGLLYYQLGQVDSALNNYQVAMNLEPSDPDIHLAIGTINLESANYDEGISAFKMAYQLLKPNTPEHRNCSYNIALGEQLAGYHVEAKNSLMTHLKLYEDDYPAVAKLIQAHYQLEEYEKSLPLKQTLNRAFTQGDLPSHMSEMYCFEQFKWNSQTILAFENYEESKNDIWVWKHKFIIQDTLNEIDYKIETLLDTTSSEKKYHLFLNKDDTLSGFNHYAYVVGSEYPPLKTAVLQILNEEVSPVTKQGDFSQWLSNKKSEHLNGIGLSFEDAISVKSVSEEYAWLRKNYAGHTFIMQSLNFNNGKPYDILKIITAGGETKSIYFDISSFFGKGF